MAVRRRKEVEDPNNTWNMQLMAAVLAKDTKTADDLLLKGAQIDHYASADLTTLAAGVPDVRSLLQYPATSLQAQSYGAAGQGTAHAGQGAATSVTPTTAPLTSTIGTAASATTKPPTAQSAGNSQPVSGGDVLGGGHLLPNGVDPDSKHVTTITPFIAAILNGDTDTASWVAAHGGNANGQLNNNKSGTVLHFLVRTDNGPLLEQVLAKRATIDEALNIDAPEATTRLTPVRLALALRKPEMARILIRNGCANPFYGLVDGKHTSTQYACLTGDLAVLETNLSAGDNIRQKDLNGQTLMHLALLQPAVLDMLIEKGSGAGPTSTSSPALAGSQGISTSPANSPTKEGNAHGAHAATLASASVAASASFLSAGIASHHAPLTLNNAYNDDGETPLIFVIKYWSSTLAGPSAALNSPHSSAGNANASNQNPVAAVLATAQLLGAAAIAGSAASASNHGLLTAVPQFPLINIPVVAAATGHNATIATAIAMATGAQSAAFVGLGGGSGNSAAAAIGDGAGGPEATTKGRDKNADKSNTGAASFGYGLMRSALELVDSLVAKGADPSNIPDNSPLGLTPLMHALTAYAPDIIRRLVSDLKVNVNARDKTGATALHYCVTARLRGALDLLCQVEGIDLNACDRRGETPLHRAAVRGEAWAVQHLLLQSFTDVNAVDCKGYNAMHTAIENSTRQVVEALLPRCGPDVGVPPPLEKGKKAPVLKKGQPPPEPPVPLRLNIESEELAHGWTPLQLAIAHKKHALATLLINDGLAKVQRSFEGGSLLHEAVRQQNIEMVRLLLAKGADVHARDVKDLTALHVACDIAAGDLTIVEALLDASATLDDQDNFTLNTPLHLACKHEHLALVQLLLARKAKVNISNKDIEMPIHVACDGADATIVNQVISKDIITVCGMEGHVPHDPSAGPMTLEKLRATVSSAVRDFSKRNAILKALIAAGAQLATNDTDGRLPLHRAAATGNPVAVETIIESTSAEGREAMLLARDSKGWSPLHSAIALGSNLQTVSLLLSYCEQLPAGYFGPKGKSRPTVEVKRAAADLRATQKEQFEAHNVATNSKPTSASAAAPTSRKVASVALTVETDPVLSLLRSLDNSNRSSLLLAADMGRVEIGRLLVKYQKTRTDGLKKGAVQSPAPRGSEVFAN